MKRVFNVSAIPIHYTLQTTSPFTDAVINKAPWQCAPLQQYRQLQLVNGVELPVVIDSLLQPPDGLIHRI